MSGGERPVRTAPDCCLMPTVTSHPARRRPLAAPKRPSDEAIARLVRAAAAGDQLAWDALVQQYSGLLWAVARAHRLSEADAADVVQATWLRLFEHLARLHDPARVGAWLATTARRECLHVLRSGERVIPAGDDLPEIESSDAGLGEAMFELERDAALWRGFAQLRASDQALLRLLVADPRPAYEEIAAALDIPIGSIGPTRGRALARLRDELETERALTLMHD